MFNNIYKNKKVLITGHTGFKGTWLSVWLLSLGAKVVGISKDIPTSPSMFQKLDLQSKITHYKEDIRKLFNNILRESFHTISIKYFENETLAKLRDTLLPKLISGELRITDAEALVDEAV